MKRPINAAVREKVAERRRAGYRARAVTISQLRVQWEKIVGAASTGTFFFVTRGGTLSCVIVPPAWYGDVTAGLQPTTRFSKAELAVLKEWVSAVGIDAGQLIRESLFGTGVAEGLSRGDIERLLQRVRRVIERATEVLDGQVNAWGWLMTPLPALGGTSPISLLNDDAGEQTVLDLLVRIEHGVPS